MHPLDSAKLKAKRANKHIRSLNMAISRTKSEPNVTYRQQGELKIPNIIKWIRGEKMFGYEVAIDPAIELNWSLIVGDILGNLRASLDHIAWALAEQRCKEKGTSLKDEEEKDVKFPLRLKKADTPYRTGVGLYLNDVRFFPDRSWDTVEYFQPYNRRQRPKTKLLGVLNQLVNIDKHRFVVPVIRDAMLRLTSANPPTRASLKEPGKFSFLVPESMINNLKPEVTFDVVLNVAFLFPNIFPVSDFYRIHNFIRDKVIPAFAGFFT